MTFRLPPTLQILDKETYIHAELYSLHQTAKNLQNIFFLTVQGSYIRAETKQVVENFIKTDSLHPWHFRLCTGPRYTSILIL